MFAENLPEEAIYKLFAALSNITDMVALEKVVADFADFGVSKLPADALDLTFIEGEVVAQYLPSDLLVLADVVVDLVKAGVLDIVNNETIESFDLEAVKDVPAQLLKVQILGHYAKDLFAALVNLGLDQANFGFEPRYSGEDFAHITPEEWVNDGEVLGAALADILSAVET